MTKDDLIKILLDECNGNYRTSHENADEALMEYIDDKDIAKAFWSMWQFWNEES